MKESEVRARAFAMPLMYRLKSLFRRRDSSRVSAPRFRFRWSPRSCCPNDPDAHSVSFATPHGGEKLAVAVQSVGMVGIEGKRPSEGVLGRAEPHLHQIGVAERLGALGIERGRRALLWRHIGRPSPKRRTVDLLRRMIATFNLRRIRLLRSRFGSLHPDPEHGALPLLGRGGQGGT
jgi:hypothetical protein